MKIYFKSKEQYNKAWTYLMTIGGGFTHCNVEGNWWIELTPSNDPLDDEDTMERLQDIAKGK